MRGGDGFIERTPRHGRTTLRPTFARQWRSPSHLLPLPPEAPSARRTLTYLKKTAAIKPTCRIRREQSPPSPVFSNAEMSLNAEGVKGEG